MAKEPEEMNALPLTELEENVEMKDDTRTNVLVIAHHHPELSPGGGERVAYGLFQALQAREDTQAFFLAAVDPAQRTQHVGTSLQSMEGHPNEWLLTGGEFDYFLQSQRRTPLLTDDFAGLLAALQPDIIHFHHTLRLGIEALAVVKQVLPHAKIVYTLHDFLPICARDGQMVTRPDNRLCDHASPTRCHGCFPDVSAARFLMREQSIRTHFEWVDHFVAPSRFLAKRYVEWGIPAKKITVLENGLDWESPVQKRKAARADKRSRFAYFGQLTPYKGVDVLLKATKYLEAQGYTDYTLDIYGDAGTQEEAFIKEVQQWKASSPDCVRFHGRYDPAKLPELMEAIDWLVVPSIWWENAPMVIAEARASRRPVICSGIGGMAEFVQDGVSGLHVSTGDEHELAQVLYRAAETPGLWQKLMKRVSSPPDSRTIGVQHHSLYTQLLGQEEGQQAA